MVVPGRWCEHHDQQSFDAADPAVLSPQYSLPPVSVYTRTYMHVPVNNLSVNQLFIKPKIRHKTNRTQAKYAKTVTHSKHKQEHSAVARKNVLSSTAYIVPVAVVNCKVIQGR